VQLHAFSPLDPNDLNIAIEECERFLRFVDDLRAAVEKHGDSIYWRSSERAAIRRSTEDVRRAMLKLQKSKWMGPAMES
jgi:hypothetical protein